uniref:Isoform A of Kinetochore and Eb1-associated basic protein n=1 Tax=Drosophila melanogaster TaxID=7227 RepID=F0JAI6-2|nr:kinetochore and EB1 associated basic protein, isoform A [Drosophila melanogaster]AAF51310.2 kinetochore and EB1 associated basic protein, isoform A [Drosophila melanogaster]AAK93101.1 LD22825p [Drosophila melanogaster]AOQ10335.1 Kebab-RA [synthetic construct]|eukprot:NP_722756.1 kinetochore and EB1 associated basic protein, isoform A [Drosophila melanogaster]
MSSMAKSPDMRTPGCCSPLRTKELLERQRSSRCTPAKGYLTPRNCQSPKHPEMRIPSIFVTDADYGLERPKQLLQRLERSLYRSSSASKVPPKHSLLASQNRQRTWEGPKTPEFRRTNKTIPASEPRPRRAKELLEDLRSKHQGTPATKIPSQRNPKENQELSKSHTCIPSSEPQPIRPKLILERERQESITNRLASTSIDRLKTKPPRSSFTSSRLLVPQMGFSYPKDPKRLHESDKGIKLTTSKRKLDFKTELGTDWLRRELEKIGKEWRKKTDYQLRQLISGFVKQLVRLLPFNGITFSHLSRDCYVQQMVEALQQLQYTKKVNKSWLQTPNSTQAIAHVLELLNFLLDVLEHRKGEGMCALPVVSEKQRIEQLASASGTSYDVMSLQQKFENIKIEKERLNNYQESLMPESPVSKDMDKVTERDGNQDFVRLLDFQKETLHELQLQRLRLQEFSELVSLAKIKLKRCCKANKQCIEAFNDQIQDLADCVVLRNRNIGLLTQLHLNDNPKEEELHERMKQLQRLYEDNYSNLLQLNIKPPQGSP